MVCNVRILVAYFRNGNMPDLTGEGTQSGADCLSFR